MCMKNVNLTIISADILGNMTGEVSLGCIDKNVVITDEGGNRQVPLLQLALIMQAVQSNKKDELKKVDPSEKVIFEETYSIKIRLTESKSGKAIDLEEFKFCASDIANTFKDCVCCDTFKFIKLCSYENIKLPCKKDDEFFVIKVLIKHLSGDDEYDATKKWTVQTVYPVSFKKENVAE